MTSVLNTLERLYLRDDSVPFHIFFLILSMIVSTCIISLGPENTLSIISYSIFSLIALAFFLKFINNQLNNKNESLPDIDHLTLIGILKSIPLFIIVYLITAVLGLIPILGLILSGIFYIIVMPIITIRFCLNYNISEALNYESIKELIMPFLAPCLFLSLKLTLFTAIIIITFFTSCFLLARDNIFMLMSLILYFGIIIQFIYADNIAQIYKEINLMDNED